MRLVADLVSQRLTEWGVQRVYGYPGDGVVCPGEGGDGLPGVFDVMRLPDGSYDAKADRQWLVAPLGRQFTGIVQHLPGCRS